MLVVREINRGNLIYGKFWYNKFSWKFSIGERIELVTELKREFDTVGIDYNVPIPQVSWNSELEKYDLESGFGRDALFDEVNQEYYI